MPSQALPSSPAGYSSDVSIGNSKNGERLRQVLFRGVDAALSRELERILSYDLFSTREGLTAHAAAALSYERARFVVELNNEIIRAPIADDYLEHYDQFSANGPSSEVHPSPSRVS